MDTDTVVLFDIDNLCVQISGIYLPLRIGPQTLQNIIVV